MGDNEAGLPNMSLQGKCQQPLKCSQSETSAVLLTLCVRVPARVCASVHVSPLSFEVFLRSR